MSPYYWAIKWKKYGEGDLYVTEKQKEYIEAEWVKDPKDRVSQQFKIKGEYYSYDSIEGIRLSTKRIENETALLYADNAPNPHRVPLIGRDDGEEFVITKWMKRYVSQRVYENDYAKRSSYKVVDKDEGGVWVAVRLPVYEDGYVPTDMEECTEFESERLWKSLKEH